MNNFWVGRPVFVTGATGFLGSWLVKRLVENGARVVCLVRCWPPNNNLVGMRLWEQVGVVHGDVCNQELLEHIFAKNEIDTVIHLAAQTLVTVAYNDPILTFQTNIGGCWSILQACRHSPMVKQIVLASSDKAYGDHETLPYDETLPLKGLHPYDVSKSCADLIAQAYAHSYEVPLAITRCGNFYGGGDFSWNRIVPGTVRSILRGQRPLIRSDGQFARDYFYVEDAVTAYMLLTERLAVDPSVRGHAFNFSNGNELTVLEIVQRILTLMQSDLKPDVKNEVKYEIRKQYLSTDKARRALGWKPQFTLDEGLIRTIEWYKSFFLAAPKNL